MREREGEPILHLAQQKDSDAPYIKEYMTKALNLMGGTGRALTLIPTNNLLPDGITIASLEECLNNFIQFIENDKRMTFWKYDPKLKKHRWTSSPEQHGQNLLHTFFKSRFGEKVESIEEVNTGAGRIDIYLRFQNGLKTIIELKMCGSGYSEGYAVEGTDQLFHYLKNKKTHLGYLVVFDGRMRDFGKGIVENYSYNNFTIRSFVADVRPKIK